MRFSIGSRMADGRRAATLSDRKYFNLPPNKHVQVVPLRSVADSLARHREWLAASGWVAVPLPASGLAERLLEIERELVEHQVARGVFKAMTEREVERLERKAGGRGIDPALANSKLFQVLRHSERALWIVLVVLLFLQWRVPIGPGNLRRALVLALLLLACLAALIVIGLVRFILVRAERQCED